MGGGLLSACFVSHWAWGFFSFGTRADRKWHVIFDVATHAPFTRASHEWGDKHVPSCPFRTTN